MVSKQLITRSAALLIAAAMVVPMLTSCAGKKKTVTTSGASTAETSETSGLTSGASSMSSANSATASDSNGAGGSTKTGKKTPITRVDLTSKVAKVGTPSAYKTKTYVSGDVVIYPIKDPVITETKMNLKGATIKFGTFWPTEYKSVQGSAGYGSQALQSVAKDYGCTIKPVQLQGGFETTLQSYSSAGLVLANVFDTQGFMTKAIMNNNFQDLRKVDSVNLAQNKWNEATTLGSSYKGGIYGVLWRLCFCLYSKSILTNIIIYLTFMLLY